jgi:hypothetical protein
VASDDVSITIERTPGVVHFFSPPPEQPDDLPVTTAPPHPSATLQGVSVVNVGAAPTPAPFNNNMSTATLPSSSSATSLLTHHVANKSDDLLFASFPTTPNEHSGAYIQMTPTTSVSSTTNNSSVTTPITPAIQSDTSYGSHDGMTQPILMNGSAPPISTHALYISTSTIGNTGGLAALAPPPATSPHIRPRGLSSANKLAGAGAGGVGVEGTATTSYVSAIANWKHSVGAGGTLMTRTPSEGSLAVSPITIPILHTTPATPLLAPTVASVNGIMIPSTPLPQRMATTASSELIDLRIKHRFLLRLMKAIHGMAYHTTVAM